MTDIAEVLFIKDAQNRQTGWEFYPAGAHAHFFNDQAAALVAGGWAVFRTAHADSPSPPAPAQPEQPPPPVVNYDGRGWTVAKLRAEARSKGITVTSGMKKADLVAALKG